MAALADEVRVSKTTWSVVRSIRELLAREGFQDLDHACMILVALDVGEEEAVSTKINRSGVDRCRGSRRHPEVRPS